MSLIGKLFLSLSGLSLIIMVSTSFILGGWFPVLFIFLGLFIISLVVAVAVDYRFYLGFLLMKTTKNGMSMGAGILITLVFCTALAYLSSQFKFSVDVTEEKINSLAPQTVQVLEKLKEDLEIVVFYKGNSDSSIQKKKIAKDNLLFIKQKSSKVKMFYHDMHLKNKLAREFLKDKAYGKEQDIFVFVKYQSKKILVEYPFDEAKLTSAIIRVTRRGEKIIYSLVGHGEREFSLENGSGISELEKALSGSAFQVKTWSLAKDGEIPKNASAVFVFGPQRPYLDQEIALLEKYLQKGGSLLVALDPDRDTSLKELLSKYGVQYNSNYILDKVGAIRGFSVYSPMGVYFDTMHPITRSMPKGAFSLFHLSGHLEFSDKVSAYKTTDLVKTTNFAVSSPDLNPKEIKARPNSYPLGVLVESKVKKEESSSSHLDHAHHGHEEDEEESEKEKEKEKEPVVKLAVFGDSDFFSNDLLNKGMNRDLTLNTVSYLADQSDLVSIRPRKLKATTFVLKKFDQMGIILFAVILPLVFFISSFVVWLRRSGS